MQGRGRESWVRVRCPLAGRPVKAKVAWARVLPFGSPWWARPHPSGPAPERCSAHFPASSSPASIQASSWLSRLHKSLRLCFLCLLLCLLYPTDIQAPLLPIFFDFSPTPQASSLSDGFPKTALSEVPGPQHKVHSRWPDLTPWPGRQAAAPDGPSAQPASPPPPPAPRTPTCVCRCWFFQSPWP